MRDTGFSADNQKSNSTFIFVVVLLFTFLIYSKFKAADKVVLSLEITENKEIILDGNHTSILEFPSVIDQSIEKLQSKGIEKDHIVIALHAAPNLNLGVISDVQQELRKNDLRRITYQKQKFSRK